eukprot:TRINITY_DN354_c1_g2_i1.p1 TRINITY_DN354_c1_g2~~TRINITY_DN354_c1_g2_i1.p1  ORF type:complete len:877 (+),score=244.99 TRINITY_DN354_c1_g2_i1:64-2694(+)
MMRSVVVLALLGSAAAGDALLGEKDFACGYAGFQIQWLSSQRALVTCRAGKGGAVLWMTNDGGKTWTTVQPEVCGNRPACVAGLQVERPDDHMMILTNFGAEEWAAGGEDIHEESVATYKGQPLMLSRIEPHPYIRNNGRVLGFARPQTGDTRHYKLYHSSDFGKTFEELPTPSTHHIYSASGYPWVDSVHWGMPTAAAGGSYDSLEVFYVVQIGDWMMVDAVNVVTKKRRTVMHDVRAYYSIGGFQFYFVLKQSYQQDLFVSADNGEHMNEVTLPHTERGERFTVVGVDFGVIFLAVYHRDCLRQGMHSPRWGSLYQSDRIGRNFYTSLKYIRMTEGNPDFHKAGGLDGVYIANRAYVEEEHCAMCADEASCDRNCRYITMMSWENGDPKSWSTLRVPDEMKSACGTLGDHCYLNLHDMASTSAHVPKLMSKFTSPGVIVGAGNVGDSLDITGEAMDMYLTVDGGESWRKILDGAWSVDWTNYGGLMVACRMENITVQTVRYSRDMGLTWHDMKFTDDAGMKAIRITASGKYRADPQSASFTVQAIHVQGSNENKVKLYTIDINEGTGFKQPCVVPKKGAALAPDSPFQTFTPKNYIDEGDSSKDVCFMGKNAQYLQKKPGQTCWNPVEASEMETTWSVAQCACKRSDYECEAGFRMRASGCESEVTKGLVWDESLAEFVDEVDSHVPVKCSLEAEDYMRTKGWVLKAGYGCRVSGDDATNLLPVKTKCPLPPALAGPGHFWSKFFIVVFFLVACALGCIWFGASQGNPTCIALKMILGDLFGSCLKFGKEGVNKISQGYRPAHFEQEVDSPASDNEDGMHTSYTTTDTPQPVGLVAAPHDSDSASPRSPEREPSPAGGGDNDSFANFAAPSDVV